MAPHEYVFLQLGDIKGRETSEKFKGQIVIQKMSYGSSHSGQWEEQNPLSVRSTNFSDWSCGKWMDVSSPSIATAVATKTQHNEAVISVTSGTKDS